MSTSPKRVLPGCPRSWRRPHGLAAALLLSLAAAPLPLLADGYAARRGDLQPEDGQAWVRLHPDARRAYFEDRRQLERRGSEQRLAQLRQLEDCLSVARQRSVVETCLAQGRQRQWQQRRQWLSELLSLRQRYGLPEPRPWQERSGEPAEAWRRSSLNGDRWGAEGAAQQPWTQQPRMQQPWTQQPWPQPSWAPRPLPTPQPGWSPQPSGWQALYDALLPFGLF